MKHITYHTYQITHYSGDIGTSITLLDHSNNILDIYVLTKNIQAFFFLNNNTFAPIVTEATIYTQL